MSGFEENLFQTLSEEERRRAEGFLSRKDRAHFIATRGTLRLLLSHYLKRDPRHLAFSHSSYGKPRLVRECGDDAILFNVSHSDGLALFAVTCGREIGVDLERIRADLDIEPIAERFFSPREVAVLRSLPADMRRDAFFACWTRKEAYVKARGEGLSLRLDQFDVSLAPGEPAAVLSVRGDPREASRWSLQELTANPGYAAALAAEGSGWRLACWRWPPEGAGQWTA